VHEEIEKLTIVLPLKSAQRSINPGQPSSMAWTQAPWIESLRCILPSTCTDGVRGQSVEAELMSDRESLFASRSNLQFLSSAARSIWSSCSAARSIWSSCDRTPWRLRQIVRLTREVIIIMDTTNNNSSVRVPVPADTSTSPPYKRSIKMI